MDFMVSLLVRHEPLDSIFNIYESIVTVITSQNSLGIQGVFGLPRVVVVSQLQSILQDIAQDIKGVKIGVVLNDEIIDAIAIKMVELKKFDNSIPIILDPVILSSSREKLLQENSVDVMIRRLIPHVTLNSQYSRSFFFITTFYWK